MSAMFPTVNLLINLVERRRAVARRREVNSGEIEVGIARRVPLVPRADPDVGRDGDVHGVDDPAGVGVGRPHPGGARHRAERRPAGRTRARRRASPAPRVPTTSASTTRAPSTPVLADISFATAPGQTTAIVGSTGAGKTTLVNLILRLFDSTEGQRARRRRRRARPRSRRAVEHDRLRAAAAVPVLGHGRAATSQFGKPDATEDEMWNALEVAQAADFVARHARRPRRPHRAGRHQRVGRAAPAAVDRAGADPPPDIYVFDDSFSALDLATDARLRAALVPVHARRRGGDRGAAGLDDRRPPTTSSCSRTARSSAAARTTS